MKHDLGEREKLLGYELSRLGFENYADIIKSARDLPNPKLPPLEDWQWIHMKDPKKHPFDIKFEFKASQKGKNERWSIYYIEAILPSTAQNHLRTPKDIVKKYFTNEPFPKKADIIKDLFTDFRHEQLKEELIVDRELQQRLEKLGFENFNELVTGSTQFFAWIHLHGSVDVNESIGTGMDRVDFLIKLRLHESYGSYSIEQIVATLHSPTDISHGELGPTSITYTRLEEKFPTVDKMVNAVIAEERQRFLAYANAYRLVKDLNAAKVYQKKPGRRKEN